MVSLWAVLSSRSPRPSCRRRWRISARCARENGGKARVGLRSASKAPHFTASSQGLCARGEISRREMVAAVTACTGVSAGRRGLCAALHCPQNHSPSLDPCYRQVSRRELHLAAHRARDPEHGQRRARNQLFAGACCLGTCRGVECFIPTPCGAAVLPVHAGDAASGWKTCCLRVRPCAPSREREHLLTLSFILFTRS